MPKDSNIPRYKVIEKDILDKINSQYYKIKETIPTEKELADEYHVSRVTVRKATDSLVMKGLLKRVAGSGTYVQDSPAHQSFLAKLGSQKKWKSLA
jgi:DNA-binding GntR family transcriptional regulator